MKRSLGPPKREDSFRGNLGGYTLIEALMVVAISSTIFVGVTVLFAGSRDKVDFNQAKVDIETKLKSYVNQVSTGTFAGSITHSCSVSSVTRPILTFVAAGVGPGTSDKCTYLGKAILTHNGATKLYVYDILGLRNKHEGTVDSGQPARNHVEASPEPAGCLSAPPTSDCLPVPGGGNFRYLFVEEYELPAGLSVDTTEVAGNTSNILKIYSQLEGGRGSSRGVMMFAEDFMAGASDVSSTRLRDCIHDDGGLCAGEIKLEANGWNLCVHNSDDSKQANINIKPTSTGAVTKVTDGVC